MSDRLEEMKLALIMDGQWEGIEAPYGEALILKEVFDDHIYDNLNLGPGDRVLDLGAHVGCFTVLAMRAGVDVVWSIEPFPPNVRCIRANVMNQWSKLDATAVHIIPAAIGAEDTETVFRVGRGSSFSFGTVPKGRGRAALEVPVPVVSIGRLIDELRPNVLKIDVEGAEYDSLLPLLRKDLNALDDVDRISGEFHVNTEEMFQHALELAEVLEWAGFVRRRKALPKSKGGWPWVNDWTRLA